MNALIIVDLQLDFCQNGTLAVPDADVIVPIVNRKIPEFDLTLATKEWHSAKHMAFAINQKGKKILETVNLHGFDQVLWPSHCVENTPGASFHPQLNVDEIDAIFLKGTHPEIHNYSGFFNDPDPYARKNVMDIVPYLQEHGVKEVTVCGLALDYCVKYTALDAKSLGFETKLLVDATRAVNIQPNDGEKAIEEMRAAGVIIV